MNSDTDILVNEIIVRAHAVESCPACHATMISSEDQDAEKMAYGMATNAWKDGQRGFRGMEREEVISLVERALALTPVYCPRCNRY